MMEFSIERLKSLAEEMPMIIQQELVGKEGYKERTIEKEIRKQLNELRRLKFSMILSQSDGVADREIPCECGDTLKYQRRREA
jgi:hypothetical protein